MNFIRLYIGDYMRDTGALSVSEHGASMLMLLHHYATEKPLPVGRELYRLLRAESKADRDAIDSVARRFWTETPDGLINNRAREEMARAEHQREVNRIVGAKGGRPKRKETESVTESVSDSIPNANPNQTPDTNTPPYPPSGEGSGEPKPGKPTVPCPYEAIVSAYHAALPMLPSVRVMTTARQRLMRQRWGWVLSTRKPDGTRRAETAEQALAWFAAFFARAAGNDFLTGRTPRSSGHEAWIADLDFLLGDKGLRHVVERTTTEVAA